MFHMALIIQEEKFFCLSYLKTQGKSSIKRKNQVTSTKSNIILKQGHPFLTIAQQ